MNHTPGPWYHSFDQRGHDVRTSPEFCKGTLIAAVGGGVDRPANARLIAAAPELLEALKRLLGAIEADVKISPTMPVKISFETNGMAIDEARAAIAKAEGRE